MTSVFLWVRYSLILIPAICSMYIENYESNSWYILSILFLLSFVELRRNYRMLRDSNIAISMEIGLSTWIAISYEGILYWLIYSSVISGYQITIKRDQYLTSLLGIIGLNYVLYENASPISLIVTLNLSYGIMTILLYYIRKLTNEKLDSEQLNDELRLKHYQLDETQKQVVDFAKKVEYATQLEERNRISREIHDELGHKLIRLKLMMDAAVRILPIQADKGIELAQNVQAQLTESMELLRATVSKLNPGNHILRTYSLEKLVQDLRSEGRLNIDYSIEGMPYALYPSIEVVMHRNAQEAITNAVRHGNASQVSIRVSYEPDQITMQISNDGELPKDTTRRGLGLSGMEERVKLIGGELLINAQYPFTVTTILPSWQ
ncbi:sensor histidine kinase [Paenibacillus albiflavus]|uniref:histidine kinase n=1 Tax=Paenibacillus albiflavus TaxID=2545760 RepID=A0A4R4EM71_9BACL|nr:sensor histidine kinase [Paenibacillus albiflavus]TCZ79475.1 sensor histidine kinase [Paenibacillus albiflavus]